MRNLIKKLKYYLRYLLIPDDKYVKYKFKKYFGYELDLEKPSTLNEKLQWLKIHDRTPLHTICADKFEVRKYIEDKIGSKYLIPLIFETINADDISIERLPDFPVVAKTNHARGVCIIRDKYKEELEAFRKILKDELNNNFYYRTREWQYKNIKPRIIVEKLLLDENGNIPYDYKLICMNGKVEFIQVDMDRFTGHRKTLYNIKWEKLAFGWNYPIGDDIQKPQMLDEMIRLAEVLAQDFCFVRVDFYLMGDKIYFGELTFHPAGGFGKFNPHEADLELGKRLNLKSVK